MYFWQFLFDLSMKYKQEIHKKMTSYSYSHQKLWLLFLPLCISFFTNAPGKNEQFFNAVFENCVVEG